MANNVNYNNNSPNYTPSASVRGTFGYPRSIDWITIHWWGDPNQNPSFEGVVSWLCNPRSQVSAHDVITGTGSRVAVIVNNSDAAWHAGSGQGNATSLGFECDPRARNEDYEAVAQDVAETWRYYGREIPLRPHNSWVGTTCPGVYDLNRIANRAREINAPAKPVTPAKPAAPAVKEASRLNYSPVKNFTFNKDSKLYEILNYKEIPGSTYAKGSQVQIAQRIILTNGNTWYRTKYSADKEIGNGFRAEDLVEIVDKPEWVRNLKDITDVKLTVLPASGTKVIDLNTLKPVNDVIIPKGTQVDIAKETTVSGKKYYISNYSANANIANGVLASNLGIPATPPAQEKPEWLKNLKDIEDKDMWTRSETPVLNLEKGDVLERLPINTKVRVTHATQLVGKDLLVLEGQKTCVETVYLSDKMISNPDKDLEARVGVLERLIEGIMEFLSNIFKNFKK